MKKKSKLTAGLLIWLGMPLALAAGLSGYYFFRIFYLPSCKRDLQKNTVEKGKLLVEMLAPSVQKAVDAGDDLGVMASLGQIAENPDFSYARVLNSSGTLIAHNNINEWGKTYSGALTREIISASGMSVYPRKDPDGYDCSLPLKLANGEIVFFSVGLSDYKILKEFAEKENLALKTGWLMFAVFVLFIEILIFFAAVHPLRKLKMNVESSAMGSSGEEIPQTGLGEIQSVAAAVNAAIKELAGNLALQKDALDNMRGEIIIVVKTAAAVLEKPYMLLDSAGVITAVSDNNLPGLGVSGGDLTGKSIIDLPDADFWAETVRAATAVDAPVVKEDPKTGIKVRAARFASSTGEVFGTIILFSSFKNRREEG
ncbi:MAG: hypothetical protein COS41_06480 [Elusimicrobia bacterium CG03_land_8_20_14_0_80_50_18]|nr:MAG: hypothetical protein COS41_06480 [Elusimicrobia bacterium CG03_land_8_20_14_0_80_50_18]